MSRPRQATHDSHATAPRAGAGEHQGTAMKAGWQTKSLADMCQIKPPKSEARQRVASDALVSFAPMEDLGISRKFLNATRVKPLASVVSNYTYFAEGDVLLAKITPCFENGKLGIAAGLSNGIGFGSSEFIVLRPCESLDKEYLYYYLSRADFRREGAARMGGAVGQQRVPQEFIESYPIPVPSLPEQQRIVGILDEAFDGIAAAKANAEKNLQNARALFESYLQSVFTQRGEGWVDTALGDVCRFVRGPFGGSLKKSIFVADGYAVYEQQHAIYDQFDDIRYFIDEVKFKEMKRFELLPNDLIMSCSGTMGRVAIVPKGIKQGIINQALLKLTPTAKISNAFVKFWMESEAFKYALGEYSGGAAIQNVASVKILKEIRVPLPSVEEQERVVAMLDDLREETQRLESIYQRKLAALDELKKSLLQKAFAGELTAKSEKSVVIPIPTKIPNITTTDLHAGILAIAYQLHEKNNKQHYYGHVKAEKIAHIIEAHLGIDLGRNPVKDAAGPNDFKHLNKVEHRARMANYFDFKRVNGAAYQVHKLGGFERLIDKTRAALGDRCEEIERLLQWMLPMTSQQAEIVATVFAAWNNLLMDGKQPTDEQIVFESRENWHPDKLKIKSDRFFSAVQWLREQGIVPEGKGRRVTEKGKRRERSRNQS